MADEQKQPTTEEQLQAEIKAQGETIKNLTKALDEKSPESIYSFSTNGTSETWTVRGRPGEDGKSFFHRVENFLKYANEHGKALTREQVIANAPSAPAANPQIAPAPNLTPQPQGVDGEGACTAILMTVGKSYKGDKPQLRFDVKEQTDPLKYTGKTLDDLVKFLRPVAAFTTAHLTPGAKFQCDYILRWKLSDPTADGKRYQNIVSIESH